MLDELVVRNLGVIEEAHLEPGPGLVVVTGETGAGKTLLIGAVRLLTGAEPRSDLVGPFAEEAVIEGRFVDGDTELTVARRLLRQGRSRTYIDGSLASAAALAERTAGLVDIVGQHDHLSLTRPSELRAMLDRALDRNGGQALAAYHGAFGAVTGLEDRQARVGGDRRALARELDLVTYQAQEIARAGFTPGDDLDLEARAHRLRNAAELSAIVEEAASAVETASESLGNAIGLLRKGERLDPSLGDLHSTEITADEAAASLIHEVRLYFESVTADPRDLADVEERLSLLSDLRRKYGVTLDEVLIYGKEAARRRDELHELLAGADQTEAELNDAREKLQHAGGQLRTARQKAGGRLQASALRHLTQMGLGDASIEFAVEEDVPTSDGADQVRLLFASDHRLTPGDVGRVASGGELSRLVLALRLAGESGSTGTLAFDEVDSGVGGRTALALGAKLALLGRTRQVLCVTHLPQVAAHAQRHYVVDRSGPSATVRAVEGDDCIVEISRMLAGLPKSERGREAAAELLAEASGHNSAS